MADSERYCQKGSDTFVAEVEIVRGGDPVHPPGRGVWELCDDGREEAGVSLD